MALISEAAPPQNSSRFCPWNWTWQLNFRVSKGGGSLCLMRSHHLARSMLCCWPRSQVYGKLGHSPVKCSSVVVTAGPVRLISQERNRPNWIPNAWSNVARSLPFVTVNGERGLTAGSERNLGLWMANSLGIGRESMAAPKRFQGPPLAKHPSEDGLWLLWV